MKKTLHITSAISLLLISGLFSYLLTQKYTVWANNQSIQLREQYAESGNISYLIQLSIVRPEKEIFKSVTHNALRAGDFALASTYNLFSNLENFNLLALESAIMYRDDFMIDRYTSNLPIEQKKEVELFFTLNDTVEDVKIIRPETNIGKVSDMVIKNNFEIYKMDSPFGENLSRMTSDYPKRTEQGLAAAHLFNDLSYYGISARITKNIIINHKCSKSAYILNSESKILAKQDSEALKSLEGYLTCDPADKEVLSLLTVYAKSLGDSQREELYSNRLKIIELIK